MAVMHKRESTFGAIEMCIISWFKAPELCLHFNYQFSAFLGSLFLLYWLYFILFCMSLSLYQSHSQTVSYEMKYALTGWQSHAIINQSKYSTTNFCSYSSQICGQHSEHWLYLKVNIGNAYICTARWMESLRRAICLSNNQDVLSVQHRCSCVISEKRHASKGHWAIAECMEMVLREQCSNLAWHIPLGCRRQVVGLAWMKSTHMEDRLFCLSCLIPGSPLKINILGSCTFLICPVFWQIWQT